MKNAVKVICIVIAILILAGCSPHLMKRGSSAPYTTPLASSMPDEFSLVVVQRNPLFLAATGVQGKISLPLLMYKDGEKKPINLVATDYSKLYPDAPVSLLALIPEPKSKLVGNQLQLGDRCGAMVCNPSTGFCSYAKGRLSGEKDTLFTIGIDSPEVISIKKGTPEFDNIASVQAKAGIRAVFIPADKSVVAPFVNGSPISQAIIEEIMTSDSFWGSELKKLLGSGWKVMLAYPLLSPKTAGFFIFITKVQEIPSFWASNDVAGCVGFKPTAYDTAEIASNVLNGMPMIKQSIGWDDPLPSDFLSQINGKVCGKSQTYRQYLGCVGEFNAAAEYEHKERLAIYEKQKLDWEARNAEREKRNLERAKKGAIGK